MKWGRKNKQSLGLIKSLPGRLVSGEGRQKKKVSLLAQESDAQLSIRISTNNGQKFRTNN